jgi:hypothetical protein
MKVAKLRTLLPNQSVDVAARPYLLRVAGTVYTMTADDVRGAIDAWRKTSLPVPDQIQVGPRMIVFRSAEPEYSGIVTPATIDGAVAFHVSQPEGGR